MLQMYQHIFLSKCTPYKATPSTKSSHHNLNTNIITEGSEWREIMSFLRNMAMEVVDTSLARETYTPQLQTDRNTDQANPFTIEPKTICNILIRQRTLNSNLRSSPAEGLQCQAASPQPNLLVPHPQRQTASLTSKPIATQPQYQVISPQPDFATIHPCQSNSPIPNPLARHRQCQVASLQPNLLLLHPQRQAATPAPKATAPNQKCQEARPSSNPSKSNNKPYAQLTRQPSTKPSSKSSAKPTSRPSTTPGGNSTSKAHSTPSAKSSSKSSARSNRKPS
jgi:hypothetical protein